MDRSQLRQTIYACDKIIELIQAGDDDALDTARGLIWRWVDQGNPAEVVNLLSAIRMFITKALEDSDEV